VSPTDVRLAAIQSEVARDWREVRRQLARAESVDPARSGPEAAFVALAIDHAYQALEQILLALERALRLPERSGERWHRALLGDAALSLPGIRPPLFPAEAERDWEDLLGFRHFLRHAYAVDLDPMRLGRNVERLRRAVELTEPSMTLLLDSLAIRP
jgi:hypothetical protein